MSLPCSVRTDIDYGSIKNRRNCSVKSATATTSRRRNDYIIAEYLFLMQIFVVSPQPEICASYLDDKRLNKMILETVQMLGTALHIHNPIRHRFRIAHPSGVRTELPKPTHQNHPLVKWVAEDRKHYSWTSELLFCLLREYRNRTGKTHEYQKYCDFLITESLNIPMGTKQFYWVNCTTHKDIKNIFVAYRLELAEKWGRDKRIPTRNGNRFDGEPCTNPDRFVQAKELMREMEKYPEQRTAYYLGAEKDDG